jgi:hypothetical protein
MVIEQKPNVKSEKCSNAEPKKISSAKNAYENVTNTEIYPHELVD